MAEVPPAKRAKTDEELVQTEETVLRADPSSSVSTPASAATSSHGDITMSAATEADVGITAFVSPNLAPFKATIKHRFADFLVHEVDKAGNIIHLQSTEVPESIMPEETDVAKTVGDFYEALPEYFESEELVAKFKAMVETRNNPPIEIQTPKPVSDKTRRTFFHKSMKKHFADFLVCTNTQDNCLVVKGGKEQGKRRGNNWSNRDWSKGEFLEFTLYKENRDTLEACSLLANMMRMSSKVFTYAGTKDKRAITVQRVSAYRVEAERLAALNKTLKNMMAGDFRYTTKRLDLGDLSGNHFVITLRDVDTPSEDTIHKSLESLRDKGFINYYGMQRFGTRSVPTHAVGLAMLQERYDKAVDLILGPKDDEREDFTAARKHWQEHKDPVEALKVFPKRCMAERSILNFFVKARNIIDCASALDSIPRNMRLMYVHAYQSYVWNCAASARMSLYGPQPVVGDLVDITGKDVTDADEEAGPQADLVLIETEEEAGKYTIEDVVLPLPGYDVVYPKNKVWDTYVEVMAKHGLDPNNMERRNKTTNLSGGYRKIVTRPKNVSWRLFRYEDASIPLSQTDLDRQRGIPPPQSVEGGSRLAIVLEFTLQPSQYATMAMYEVMKMGTGSQLHKGIAQANDGGKKQNPQNGKPRPDQGVKRKVEDEVEGEEVAVKSSSRPQSFPPSSLYSAIMSAIHSDNFYVPRANQNAQLTQLGGRGKGNAIFGRDGRGGSEPKYITGKGGVNPFLKDLQIRLPFLPGHSFEIEKFTHTSERKSHAFDYCNGVPVFKQDAPGIGGHALPGQTDAKIHTSVEMYPHSEDADGTKGVPAWVAFDRKVLRFYAYFQEAVHERREEQYRVRRVNIYFYLEDDSVHVSEPKTANSGIPQGTLIRRHRIPLPNNEQGQHYTVKDFNVGREVTFYARTFKIVGCDAFTRDFLGTLGISVPANGVFPPDPYELCRAEMLSRMKATRPCPPKSSLKKFLENDRHVLRFYCVWDDTNSVFGDLRHMVVHYYLSDDTIEIRESIPANSGRESNTLFLRRCKLPKRPKVFLYGQGPAEGEAEYFTDKDLTIGTVLHLYGRPFVICDCDEFTKEYYHEKYGLDNFDPVRIQDYADGGTGKEGSPEELLPFAPVPPDLLPFPPTSLSSLRHPPPGAPASGPAAAVAALSQPLIGGPNSGAAPATGGHASSTRKDFKKMTLYDGVCLRFAAQLKTDRQVDRDRRFVVSLHVADDTISVFEPRSRNSGIVGGKFLEKQRIMRPDGQAWYEPKDFFIGADLTFFHHPFGITGADDYAIKFMDAHPEMFPMHHRLREAAAEEEAAAATMDRDVVVYHKVGDPVPQTLVPAVQTLQGYQRRVAGLA
ncbi:EF-hand domain-containing member C2, partial [Borealophlyctis nickersoniae]